MSKTTITPLLAELKLSSDCNEMIERMAAIENNFVLGEAGTFIPKDGLYKELAPADLDFDQVRKYKEFTTNFRNAAIYIVSEKGLDAVKANRDLENITATIPTYDKDSIAINIAKIAEVPDGNGGRQNKIGATRVKTVDYSARNLGDCKKIIDAGSRRWTVGLAD